MRSSGTATTLCGEVSGEHTNAHLRLHALELFLIHLERVTAPRLHSNLKTVYRSSTTSALGEEDGRPRNIYPGGQIAVMDLWEACRSYVGIGGSLERAREESEGVNSSVLA